MIRTSPHASRTITRTAISRSASDGLPLFPHAPLPLAHAIRNRFPPTAETPARSGFAPVQSILDSFSISKQHLKHLDAIALVREQRDQAKQELGFHARPFVLCGIPLRRPPAGQLVHRRRNGKFYLEMTAHPDFGLPFGQDRLIPIWVATLAVKQKSRAVRFESASEILEFFQLPKDGLHYRRLVQGFQRIFASTIFFGTQEADRPSPVFDWARFHFFDRAELWYNHVDRETCPAVRSDRNTITLSEAFYDEVDQHRIPVERQAVATLANAPGLLDFYIWIVWKSWAIKRGMTRIPLFGAQGLQAQLGTVDYSRNKRFRQTLRRWLKRIQLLWPDCPVELSPDLQYLVVQSSTLRPAINGSTTIAS
ncbi:MAG TPA: replication protein RepA [Terriglobales bacterium]